jgi:heme exporter protein D
LVGLGVILAVIAFVVGPPASQSPDSTVADRTRTAAGLLVWGFLAGMPLIVVGQVIHLLLEQRRLLRQIIRELRADRNSGSPRKVA